MSRRKFVLFVLGILLVVGLVWLFWPKPLGLNDLRAQSITFANYQRIQEGMPQAEVNDLLGVPPGDYRAEGVEGFHLIGPGHIPRDERARGGKLEVWYIPRSHVEVLYDPHGRVLGKYWFDAGMNR